MAITPKSIEDLIDKVDAGYEYEGEEPEVDEEDDEPDLSEENDQDDSDDDDDSDDSDVKSKPEDKPTINKKESKEEPNQKAKEPKEENLTQLRNGLLQNEKGDLFDPNTRSLIARSGRERRFYENMERARGIARQLEEENVKLQKDMADLRYLNDVPRQYNLANDEVAQGLALVATFKADPVKAARKVLEMAMSMGYNATQILGENAADAIEIPAIKRMLDERLKPLDDLQRERQNAQREQEIRERAREDMERWVASRPYSSVHGDAIARLMERREMTPDEAYYELRNFAQEKGLDFTKPLKPQIERLQKEQNPQRRSQQQNPMPGRRNFADETRNRNNQDVDVEFADPQDSWQNIIKSVIRDR